MWAGGIVACLASRGVAQGVSLLGHDTGVAEQRDADSSDARRVLETVSWERGAFAILVEPAEGGDYAATVDFPSPLPDVDEGLNRVRLRWYPARRLAAAAAGPAGGEGDLSVVGGEAGEAVGGGAASVLLVHSLHPDMPVATMLARGLSGRGVHAFVLELPGYGSRAATPPRMTGVTALLRAAQAVADVRRGRDVIAALADLPQGDAARRPIDPGRIAVQGTSLGSFVAATASALDGCFSQTFLLLSGGDGLDVLRHGQKDAFHVRNALRHYGYDDAALAELIGPIEPLAIADRLDPAATWMFNAVDDVVIPRQNAERLADAIGLDPSHRVWMPGNHYTAFLLLPGVLERMCRELEMTEIE